MVSHGSSILVAGALATAGSSMPTRAAAVMTLPGDGHRQGSGCSRWPAAGDGAVSVPVAVPD